VRVFHDNKGEHVDEGRIYAERGKMTEASVDVE